MCHGYAVKLKIFTKSLASYNILHKSQRTKCRGSRAELVGGTHPGLRPVACGLWLMVRACGRDPPNFFIYAWGLVEYNQPPLEGFPILGVVQPHNRTPFLMFTIRNIFNFWIPAFSTVETLPALLRCWTCCFFSNNSWSIWPAFNWSLVHHWWRDSNR